MKKVKFLSPWSITIFNGNGDDPTKLFVIHFISDVNFPSAKYQTRHRFRDKVPITMEGRPAAICNRTIHHRPMFALRQVIAPNTLQKRKTFYTIHIHMSAARNATKTGRGLSSTNVNDSTAHSLSLSLSLAWSQLQPRVTPCQCKRPTRNCGRKSLFQIDSFVTR